MKCRHCKTNLDLKFLDLGHVAPSNAYLYPEDLNKPELTFPLRVLVCEACWLVQTEDYAASDALFRDDYAYFSSTSKGWLSHAAEYTKMITDRLGLSKQSFVVELASNDGYLLRNFVEAGIPCLGIEPTQSTAQAAEALGIPVLQEFFGEALGHSMAHKGDKADLIIGNNVFAHVPDINDFVRGISALLSEDGVVTLEFPHLMELIAHGQFDTVYHEHFSYLALHPVIRIFEQAGLRIFDVEKLPTHGGSLRIYGCLKASAHSATGRVKSLLQEEITSGLQDLQVYQAFQDRAETIKDDLLRFLLDAKRKGKKVAGYGAAAKGNTLLNFCGVRPDLLPFICDAAPSKIGKFMPGSHIPIAAPLKLAEYEPDYVLILPWNISAEVVAANSDLARAGTRFVVAVPDLRVL